MEEYDLLNCIDKGLEPFGSNVKQSIYWKTSNQLNRFELFRKYLLSMRPTKVLDPSTARNTKRRMKYLHTFFRSILWLFLYSFEV